MTHLQRSVHTLVLTLGLLLISATVNSARLWAQAPAAGELTVTITASGTLPDKLPLMVSAVRGSEIVDQKEVLAESGKAWLRVGAPAGSYDVRVSGEGVVTEVKQGVKIFAGRDVPVQVVIRPGAGLHVVEYATGGISREEVATRLRGLEASVKKLEAARDSGSTRSSVP